jgi:diphosphomevalonate decarboxylase
MIVDHFLSKSYDCSLDEGKIICEAPSNIALVKYWGKFANQMPANPSISFTLNNCKSITSLAFEKKSNLTDFSFDFYFEGEKKPAFEGKIQTFFNRISPYLPFLKNYHFTIKSENTFPHSSGIASSASAMSALSGCLMQLERQLTNLSETDFLNKTSFLSRLGSGSACRSIAGPAMIWGQHANTPHSSDLYAVTFDHLHDNFQNFQDTILLVDKGEKQVSSTVGHELMNNHPFAQNRFKQAHQNLDEMKLALSSGDLEKFIHFTESEALTLHGMMMTSSPYFMLMKPNTLSIINEIWHYRQTENVPLSFTLDAGANVHLLYPDKDKNKVFEFIINRLSLYCQNNQYICDHIGQGLTIK